MAVALTHKAKAHRMVRPPPVGGVGRLRKIGLLGSHTATLESAPWDDPSWELWGHASARWLYARPADLYFDLHRQACWTRKGKKDKAYARWLRTQTTPIYMQRVFDEVPASIEYPLKRILAEFPQRFLTSHVCYMVALALTEGVTHIGLFGCDYGAQTEYETQRGGTQFWLGIAAGRGVQLVLPEGSTILSVPKPLYGYESHDADGMLVPAYRATTATVSKGKARLELDLTGTRPLAKPPDRLIEQIVSEEADRPDWAQALISKDAPTLALV